MIEVHILPGKPHILEGKARATGKEFRIVEQAAYAVLSDGSAAAFTVQPPRDGQPYGAGKYALDPASFYVRDGKLSFSPKLVAVGGTK